MVRRRLHASPTLCGFQALSYTLHALRDILRKYPDPRVAQEVKVAQTRLPSMIVSDGVDLVDRLKSVRVTKEGDLCYNNTSYGKEGTFLGTV